MRIASLLLCLSTLAPMVALAQLPTASREFGQVLGITPDPARGAQLFGACSTCHGQGGEGAASAGVPVIGGQHGRVVARQLIDYRNAERWDPRMEAVASRHNLRQLRDIADVAAWAAGLSWTMAPATGDGSGASLGRELFQARCAGCHGRDGRGDGALLVPRLAGQHHAYLLRQLHDTLEGRRPNMPPPHADLLVDLDAQELAGLADHLSRLRPARVR